jgi:cell division septation protein DedD
VQAAEPPLSTPGRPAAISSPAAHKVREYWVLVGSFRQESEGARLADELREIGYHARRIRVESGERGSWHQVSVGPYADLDRARQDEARVRQLPGYADAHLVTH